MFTPIIYAVAILVIAAILYGIYKVIWYLWKIFRFKVIMKKISASVERKRGTWDTFFGEKGLVDLIVTLGDKKYEVCVLSFISTHGRWNIEKGYDGYFIESRRASTVFYKVYNHSEQGALAGEYKRESSVSRKMLDITPQSEEYEKQIFLLYPFPKKLTLTDSSYRELYIGDKIDGHEIMNIDVFLELLCMTKNKDK
ncbi:MAG: hypothetical protein J6Q78_03125 [Clostridia bacterium]|nr:hypothetical protein [Clostridia bacterium]